MAFASTIVGGTVAGNMRIVHGTFTNTDTDSGGSVDVGVTSVIGMLFFPTSHVDSTACKWTDNADGTVTVVTPNGVDGNWMVFGFGGG